MKILSLDFYFGTYASFFDLVKNPEKRTLVFTPNPEMLVKADRDDDFYLMLKKADYLVPDANGLYTASLIQDGKSYLRALFETFFERASLSTRYGELIQGSRLTNDLVHYARGQQIRVLMIDNYRITDPVNPFEIKKMEIQKQLKLLFEEKFPDLLIDVVFDGDKLPEMLAHTILENNIRYVFSCVGMKSQERRLIEIFSHIPSEYRVLGIGVGSSFDYLLGLQKRAPDFFQRLGLEWLYRLMQDPKARWKRIKTALIEFPRIIEKKMSKEK